MGGVEYKGAANCAQPSDIPQKAAKDPKWWKDCQARRAAGESWTSLAQRYGKAMSTVKYAVEHPERLRKEREMRQAEKERTARLLPGSRKSGLTVTTGKRKGPRKIARVIPPQDVIRKAARAFAANEISREQLSFILRGGSQG